jgi:hypothetical protein
MSIGKHYFIEENEKGKFAIRAKGSHRASRLADSQKDAERVVQQFNPEDHPDVERVRNTKAGINGARNDPQHGVCMAISDAI